MPQIEVRRSRCLDMLMTLPLSSSSRWNSQNPWSFWGVRVRFRSCYKQGQVDFHRTWANEYMDAEHTYGLNTLRPTASVAILGYRLGNWCNHHQLGQTYLVGIGTTLTGVPEDAFCRTESSLHSWYCCTKVFVRRKTMLAAHDQRYRSPIYTLIKAFVREMQDEKRYWPWMSEEHAELLIRKNGLSFFLYK